MNVQNNTGQRLRYEFDAELREEGVDGNPAWQLTVAPSYFFTPNFSTSLSLIWVESPDWLVYRTRTQELGSFARQQLTSRLGVNWFPSARSEIRGRIQWVGLRARGRTAYANDPRGQLRALSAAPAAFSQAELGLQLRYRYEMAPLSDLFLVYSRGGIAARGDAEEDLASLWSEAIDNPTADQFVVKLRYRF